jgi:catechol 2,3-dioxygenase-like lactoylglutathione lyase family enzyme
VLKGQFDHIQINVTNLRRSEKFYESVLGWLGYEKIVDNGDGEDPGIAQWHRGSSRLILAQVRKEFLLHGFHRKHAGINHISFWAPTRQVVDRFYREVLLPKKIKVLYAGPKEYPDYSKGYYAVYFEDPDRIKLELLTHSPLVQY